MCRRAIAAGPSRGPAQSAAAGGAPRLIGEVAVVTNSIDKGITQSDAGPALQAGFGYQFNAGRIGLWGSSVKYLNDDAQTNLRPYISFGFVFTPNSRLDFRYASDKYFKSSTRDSNLISLDFETYKYHAILEQDSNFEGTGEQSLWFGFAHEYNLTGTLNLDLRVGYSQLSGDIYSNYFDTRTEVKYKWDELAFALGHSYNSAESQFGDAGAMAFYVRLLAEF